VVYEQLSTNPVCEIERGNQLETEVGTERAARVIEQRLESSRLLMRYQSLGLGRCVGPEAIKHLVADGPHPLNVLDAINMPYKIIDEPDESR
jgi:hypothetical protein